MSDIIMSDIIMSDIIMSDIFNDIVIDIISGTRTYVDRSKYESVCSSPLDIKTTLSLPITLYRE